MSVTVLYSKVDLSCVWVCGGVSAGCGEGQVGRGGGTEYVKQYGEREQAGRQAGREARVQLQGAALRAVHLCTSHVQQSTVLRPNCKHFR